MAPDKPTPVRRRVRRPQSSGPPTFVLVGGLLLGVAGLYFVFIQDVNRTDTDAMLGAAVREFENGASAEQIEVRLRAAENDSSVSAAELSAIRKLRDKVKERDEAAALAEHNQIGNEYLERKLRNYVDTYLTGDPETAKVRVFLERADVFMKRWPEHPERDWVKRERERFRGAIDFNAPLTYQDIAWQAEVLTRSKPRDYATAFAAIEDFEKTAGDKDLQRTKALRADLTADRAEKHEENMVQAKRMFEYENDEQKAISRLVWGVIGTGDEAMSNEAATYLLKMPSCDAYLRGYKKSQPLVFERIAAHPMMKDRIAAL